MKILKVLGLTLILSGCIYAGDISIWDGQKDLFSRFSSYKITYLDDEGPKLVKTEDITDTSFQVDKLLTAYKGYPIVDTKSYTRNYYTTKSIVAPTDVYLSSGMSPLEIKADAKYDVIGEVTIDGQLYGLVSTGVAKNVYLVDNYGKLYPKVGLISNDRLILSDTKYIIHPEDFRFETVSSSKVVQSEMTTGFEIKYSGLKLNRIILTVMEYNGEDGGVFSDYNYPNRPGIVDIHGIKIRIYQATDNKLEYMIVVDK